MIKQEQISETLIKIYSDKGVMIHGGFPEADYVEVIDPINANRIYTETNIPIPALEIPEELLETAEYLFKTKSIELSNTDEEPDYFNEHEPEPAYFN